MDAEVESWLDKAALYKFAVVEVWATTWQLMDERPSLTTCEVDTFLREVMEGPRAWVSDDPAMPRLKCGRPKRTGCASTISMRSAPGGSGFP